MKKNYLKIKCSAILAFVALLLVGSCSKDDTSGGGVSVPVEFSIDQKTLSFNATDSLAKTISITANQEWMLLNEDDSSAYSYADWVDVSKLSGTISDDVTITLDANSTPNNRSTKLYFGLKNNSEYQLQIVTINQAGSTLQVSVDNATHWFVAVSNEQSDYTRSLNIKTNAKWRVLTADDGADYGFESWMSLDKMSGEGDASIVITVEPFSDDQATEDRHTIFYIDLDVEDFEPLKVYVNQFRYNNDHISSPTIFGTDTIFIDEFGTPFSMKLTTSSRWSIPESDDSGNAGAYSWVNISPLEGTNGDSITFSCEPNLSNQERVSRIFVTLSNGDRTNSYAPWKLVQAATPDQLLTFSQDSLFLNPAGAATELTITSSKPWRVVGDSLVAEWLTISKSEGVSGDVVSIEAEPFGGFNRESEIYLAMDYYKDMEPVKCKIYQKGDSLVNAELVVGTETASFDAVGASELYENITITSDIPWRIMTEADGAEYATKGWVKTNITSADKTAELKVSVLKNQFKSGRSTYIYLIQPDKEGVIYDKRILITQKGNEGSKIEDFGNLGRGYNSAGVYADQSEVKARVLDCDKLEYLGKIADINYTLSTQMKSTVTEDISDVQDSLNASASVSGGYSGFSADLSAKFGTSLTKYKETKYGYKSITYKKASIYTYEATKEQLKMCLGADFIADINASGSSITDKANSIVKKYGTHVILGYTLGGKYEYCTSAVRSSTKSVSDFETSVSASYDDGLNKASAGASLGGSSAVRESSLEAEEYTNIRGGSGYSNPTEWMKSIDAYNSVVMVDFAGEGLCAIWDLVDDSSLAAALKEAALTTSVELASGTVQGIYQYQFWLNQVAVCYNDSGNAEVDVDMKARIVEGKGKSHNGAAWQTVWNATNIADVPDDFWGYGQGERWWYPGVGNSNKYVTPELFLGGSKTYEIDLYFWIKEPSDEATASGCYTTLRTKQLYDKNSDAANPFIRVSVEDTEPEFPFANVDNGTAQPINDDWSRALTQDAGSGYYYNGIAAHNTANGEWMWKIYYRDLTTQLGQY